MAELRYVIGDATQPQGDGRKLIVHCVNDCGKWGRGFVTALSKRWPQPEAMFREWGWRGFNKLGAVQFVRVADDITVANLFGQHGIRHESGTPPIRYDAIAQGLTQIAAACHKWSFSVHMPRIGAGLAGGEWSRIEEIVQRCLVSRGVDVTVYDLPGSSDD